VLIYIDLGVGLVVLLGCRMGRLLIDLFVRRRYIVFPISMAASGSDGRHTFQRIDGSIMMIVRKSVLCFMR
jgi:hypothetical protein